VPDNEGVGLGPCCCCGGIRNVRNIVMLNSRASVPGTGWGCVVCGLPGDGASYICCDRCLNDQVAPRELILGYPVDCQREPIANLSPDIFKHDMSKHQPGD
jgi:hypothetical protein